MEEERKQSAIADAVRTRSGSSTPRATRQDQPEEPKCSSMGPRRTAERELRVSLADEDGPDPGQRLVSDLRDSLEVQDRKEKESRAQTEDHQDLGARGQLGRGPGHTSHQGQSRGPRQPVQRQNGACPHSTPNVIRIAPIRAQDQVRAR